MDAFIIIRTLIYILATFKW